MMKVNLLVVERRGVKIGGDGHDQLKAIEPQAIDKVLGSCMQGFGRESLRSSKERVNIGLAHVSSVRIWLLWCILRKPNP